MSTYLAKPLEEKEEGEKQETEKTEQISKNSIEVPKQLRLFFSLLIVLRCGYHNQGHRHLLFFCTTISNVNFVIQGYSNCVPNCRMEGVKKKRLRVHVCCIMRKVPRSCHKMLFI